MANYFAMRQECGGRSLLRGLTEEQTEGAARSLTKRTPGDDTARGTCNGCLQTTPRVISRLGRADTEIPVIIATKVQLQTHSTGGGSVVQFETNVFFRGGCVKKKKVSLEVSPLKASKE